MSQCAVVCVSVDVIVCVSVYVIVCVIVDVIVYVSVDVLVCVSVEVADYFRKTCTNGGSRKVNFLLL